MADDKKFDFKKLGRKKVETQEIAPVPKKRIVYQEVEEAPVEAVRTKPKKAAVVTKSKVGRKSWKDEGTKYVRMAFDTPAGTKQKVKQLLAGKFYEKYISQDEMINVALEEFIKKHYKE